MRSSACLMALLVVTAVCVSTAPGMAQRVELGGFVGYHEPVDQDDASDNILIGVRARLPLLGDLKLEPAVTWFDMDRGPYLVRGVTQEPQPWRIVGGTVGLTYGRGFGTEGLHPYLTLGTGYYFLRKDESPDTERLGYLGGVGMVVGARDDISLDVAAVAVRIPLDQGGARGLINVNLGLNYHFGSR